MGLIRVNITLEGKHKSMKCLALVDTGATFSVIPQSAAKRLGLTPMRSYTVELADGRVERLPATTVGVKLDGRSAPVTALISPRGEMLLGAETLEVLDVTIDPKRRKLKMGTHFALKAA